MDPDAALDELLDLTGPLLDTDHADPTPAPAPVSRIAELVDALDGWLLTGGYLPRRWAGPARPAGAAAGRGWPRLQAAAVNAVRAVAWYRDGTWWAAGYRIDGTMCGDPVDLDVTGGTGVQATRAAAARFGVDEHLVVLVAASFAPDRRVPARTTEQPLDVVNPQDVRAPRWEVRNAAGTAVAELYDLPGNEQTARGLAALADGWTVVDLAADGEGCPCGQGHDMIVQEPAAAGERLDRVETLTELVQEWVDAPMASEPLQTVLDRLESLLPMLGAPALTDDEQAAVVAGVEG